ncbi:unannotated protein [freshwater metagenome]|uniref:Unannotated protein n=1 Tax=freshwater metagenome TaxID=449393 RepID=A0A6J7EC30_9ZZZZ
MRTTVTLRDDIYREVKQVAATQGCSVGSVIEDAISLLLARRSEAADTSSHHFPDLPVFTGGGLRPGVDLDSNASLSELLDEGTALDALR